MRQVWTAITISVLIFSGMVWAADWPVALKDAEARCQRQHAAIKDLTIVQQMNTTTPQGQVTAEQTIYQRGNQSRLETVMHMPGATGMDGMKTTVISTGSETWMSSPMTGKQKLSPEEAQSQEVNSDCWGFNPENSRIVGSDTSEGRDCWLVEMTKDSVTHKLLLDKQTLNVLGGESSGAEGNVRWQLSDYRPVTGDYQHPYKVEMFEGQELLSTMTVQSVAANTGLSDTLFDASRMDSTGVNMEELIKQMLQQQAADSDTTSGQK